jgi:hypothetical protein
MVPFLLAFYQNVLKPVLFGVDFSHWVHGCCWRPGNFGHAKTYSSEQRLVAHQRFSRPKPATLHFFFVPGGLRAIFPASSFQTLKTATANSSSKAAPA